MIIKLSSGTDLKGVLAYNQSKVEKGQASVIYSSQEDNLPIEFEMKSLIEKNSKVKNPIFSCSINPHPDESNVISDQVYSDIAREYMNGMGYGNQPYVVIKHQDTDRTHIHIVSVRIDENGKKIDSNYEKYKSNALRKVLQEKYKLLSENERTSLKQKRNNQSLNENDVLNRYREVHVDSREEVRRVAYVLRYVKDHYKVIDLMSLNRVLGQFNVRVEEDNGNAVYYNGRNERFTLNQLFFSKSERQQLNISAWDSHFKHNKMNIKLNATDVISDLKDELDGILSNSAVNNVLELKDELAKRKISLNIYQSKSGSISGMTLIDNVSGYIFKASELGKDYSTNAIIKKLDSQDKVGYNENIRWNKNEVIAKIKNSIDEILRNDSDCKTIEQFKHSLENYNIRMILVDNRGLRGCRFALLDDNGNVYRHIVSGTTIGKNYTLNSINKRLKSNYCKEVKQDKNIERIIKKIYNEVRKRNYYFESDLIKNLDLYRESMLNSVSSLKIKGAADYVDKFIAEKKNNLEEVINKEIRYNRATTQLMVRYAAKIEPVFREEFLLKLGIEIERNKDLCFRNSINKSYVNTWQDISLPVKGYNVGLLNPFSPIDFPSMKEKSEIKSFSKKQREIFKAVITNTIDKLDLSDLSISLDAINNFIGRDDRNLIEKQLNKNQCDLLCSNNYENTSQLVNNLLYRGIAIVPAVKEGKRTYIAGNILNSSKENFVELPNAVVNKLVNSNYDIIYKEKLNSAIWSKNGYPTQKIKIISALNIAQDKNTNVDYILESVAKTNKELELSLRKDIVNGTINYSSMIDKVVAYNGNGFSADNFNIKQFLSDIKDSNSAVSTAKVIKATNKHPGRQ